MKLSSEALQAIITFIVGGGLVTLVTQIVRSWGSLKSGARASTREVIRDLAAARDEAEDREAALRLDKDYWRGVAGDYAFQLRTAGHRPVPERPRSPSEERRDEEHRARRRRAERALTTEEIRLAVDDE